MNTSMQPCDDHPGPVYARFFGGTDAALRRGVAGLEAIAYVPVWTGICRRGG
jgi:hypothetical protein